MGGRSKKKDMLMRIYWRRCKFCDKYFHTPSRRSKVCPKCTKTHIDAGRIKRMRKYGEYLSSKGYTHANGKNNKRNKYVKGNN